MTDAAGQNPPDLAALARRIRATVVEMSHHGGAPHLGSALSCVDILVAAYWSYLNVDPANSQHPLRDRFILSKGHASSALYAVLAARGFFPQAQLADYCRAGSGLSEHMAPGCLPGIEAATGSLGHGLSLGVGLALAGKIQGRGYRVCVVLSDGECNEGSVWEAAMFAAAQSLDNLLVVIDFNRWQATGRSEEILAISPLREKWEAFGWSAVELNGHDIPSLREAMSAKHFQVKQPKCIVARTIKGRGVSFMEDDNNWHYRIPTEEEVQLARGELGQP